MIGLQISKILFPNGIIIDILGSRKEFRILFFHKGGDILCYFIQLVRLFRGKCNPYRPFPATGNRQILFLIIRIYIIPCVVGFNRRLAVLQIQQVRSLNSGSPPR